MTAAVVIAAAAVGAEVTAAEVIAAAAVGAAVTAAAVIAPANWGAAVTAAAVIAAAASGFAFIASSTAFAIALAMVFSEPPFATIAATAVAAFWGVMVCAEADASEKPSAERMDKILLVLTELIFIGLLVG